MQGKYAYCAKTMLSIGQWQNLSTKRDRESCTYHNQHVLNVDKEPIGVLSMAKFKYKKRSGNCKHHKKHVFNVDIGPR